MSQAYRHRRVRKCPSPERSPADPTQTLIFLQGHGAPVAQSDQPLPRLVGRAPGAGSGRRDAGVRRRGGAGVAAQAAHRVRRAAAQQRSGCGGAHTTQKRMGDLSLLLIGIRSPDYAGQPALRRGADPEAARAAPDRRQPRDLPRQGRARLLRAEQVALRLGGRPRSDPRPAAQRDQQAQEPAVRLAGRRDESIDAMRARMSGKSGLDDRFPGGVFTSKDGEYVWIAALPPGGLFVENAGEALFNAANQLIAQDPPSNYHPAMRAEVAGPIATAIASRHAVERDILWVTVTCLVIVALSIGLYFRRLRAIPLTGIPAVIGTVVGVRRRGAGVRLPQLVDGVPGVDHHRQRHQLRHRADVALRGAPGARRAPHEALRSALGGHLARRRWSRRSRASAAYASLMVTSFRGFYQFGVMGAAGALCLLGRDLHGPAGDAGAARPAHRAARRPQARAPLEFGLARALPAAARGGRSRSRSPCSASSAWSACGTSCKDPFEYDFRKLNAKLATDRGGAAVRPEPGQAVRALAVADDRPRRRASTRSSRSRRRSAARTRSSPATDVIGQIVTIYDLCPARPRCSGASWAIRADPQADARPGAGGADREGARRPGQDRSARRPARAGAAGPAAARAPAVHRGRRHRRAGGAGLPARDGALGLERARPAAASPRCCSTSSSTTAR